MRGLHHVSAGRSDCIQQQYDSILKDHNCETYLALVKGIYLKGQKRKKLGQTDQRYMKRAEELLYGELAAALGISPREVPTIFVGTTLAVARFAGRQGHRPLRRWTHPRYFRRGGFHIRPT